MAVFAACGRTPEGDLTIDRPGDVDVDVTTDTIRLPDAMRDTVRDTLHRDTLVQPRY